MDLGDDPPRPPSGRPPPFWCTGYLYVADEAGYEIAGSRRSLSRCRSKAEYAELHRQLERAMGEDCMVKHSAAGPPGPRQIDKLVGLAAIGGFWAWLLAGSLDGLLGAMP